MIYRIYKDKRHQMVGEGDLPIHGQGLRYIEADADGWIPWNGGECPLPDDQPCEAKTRSGEQAKFNAAGHVIGWKKAIAYYRPILDADTKPEPPAWDGEGLPPVGCVLEAFADGGWCKAEWLKQHNGEHAVFFIRSRALGWATDIRPIRSEEDRAKEAIAEEVLSAMDNGLGPFYKDAQIAAVIYAAIRDGKVPGVKLEVGNDAG